MSTFDATTGGEEKKERRGRKKKNVTAGVITAKSTYVKKNKTYKYQLESTEVDVVQAKSSKNYRDRKNQERKALIEERDKLKNFIAEKEKERAMTKEKMRQYEAEIAFYKKEHLRCNSMPTKSPNIASALLAVGRNASQPTMDNYNYSMNNNLFMVESNSSYNPNPNVSLSYQLSYATQEETPEIGLASLDDLNSLELVPLSNLIVPAIYEDQYI